MALPGKNRLAGKSVQELKCARSASSKLSPFNGNMASNSMRVPVIMHRMIDGRLCLRPGTVRRRVRFGKAWSVSCSWIEIVDLDMAVYVRVREPFLLRRCWETFQGSASLRVMTGRPHPGRDESGHYAPRKLGQEICGTFLLLSVVRRKVDEKIQILRAE